MSKVAKVISRIASAVSGKPAAQEVAQGPSALQIAQNEKIRKKNIEIGQKTKAAGVAAKSKSRAKKATSGQRVKARALTRMGGVSRENTGLAD